MKLDGLAAAARPGNTAEVPATSIIGRAKNTAIPKVESVRCWHSRQRQTETFAGSPCATIESAPLEQSWLGKSAQRG